MKLLKVFFLVVMFDLRSIPQRIKIVILHWRARYFDFKERKLYVEKSIVFLLLFMPILLVKDGVDNLRARLERVTLAQFCEERSRDDEAATSALKIQTNQMRVETIGKFADLFPGATVNDWDAFSKDRTPVSIKFLVALLRSRR
jgi:hypothetical protein